MTCVRGCMPSMARRSIVLVVAALVGITGGPALADAVIAPEAIRLVYTAPAGCPDDSAFFAGVAARARAVLVDNAAERMFSVSIVPDQAGGFRGTLAVTTTLGTTTTREVSGASCAEAVTALALVAALAIEERLVDRPVAPAPLVVPAVSRASVPWHVAAGAGIGRYTGLSPDAVFGVPVFVTAGRGPGVGEGGRDGGPGSSPAMPSEARRIGGPHVQIRIAFTRTERSDVVSAAGTTDFRWTAGKLDGCLAFRLVGPVAIAPCVGVEGGVLTGRGTQVAMPSTEVRPWVAPDLAVRVRVHAGRFAVELEGVVAAPLVRDRFLIAPSTTIYQVPAVATGAALSVAVDLL